MKQFTKNVFITFRLTKNEKERVLKNTEAGGYKKVSDYLRSILGL